MKNLIILLSLLVFSCNKNSNQKPATPSNSTNSVNSTSLNSYETPLAYDWKLFRYYGYAGANGPCVVYNTYTNTIDCHLALTCSITANSITNPPQKVSINGMFNCSPGITYWYQSEPNIVNLGGQDCYVQTLTNDTLILTLGRSVSSYTQRFKFYK